MTTTLPATIAAPSPAELAELGEEYLTLLEMQTEITARMTEIKERFALLPFGATMAGDRLKVSVQHNVRRDDAAFQAAYPYEEHPEFYKPALDTATIKRELSPAELEQYQLEGAPKILTTVIEA